MDVLIRELRRAGEIEEYRDTTFHGERLVIGSAADAGIQIIGAQVGARHAGLVAEGAQLQLRCDRGRQVRHNGAEVAAVRLQVGDVVEIGGNRLQLVAAPAGFHFALQIEPDPAVDAGQFEAAFRTSLEQALPSRRRLSWIAIGVAVTLGLLVPLAMVMSRGATEPGQSAHPGWLTRAFGDARWSTGALTPVHAQATGNQCGLCHQSLFVRVRDTACKACHAGVADHVQQVAGTGAGAAHESVQGRCAACHREHNATAATLVPRTDTLCASCHADIRQRFADSKLPDASGFDAKIHPEFSPLMLVPDAVDASGWVTARMPLASASDQSNLKFSHQQHLDGKKVIRNSDGAALGCGDCHRPGPGGAGFQMITMRETCSSCHELTFDPSEPRRQLPHGRPREVILALQEYYARRYLDPAAAPAARLKRRIPGRSEEEEAACTLGALPCARQFAAAEIQAQFTERGCVSCHEVLDTGATSLMERFEVVPVRLADRYFPSARFDHAAHRIQKDLAGDAACLSCHGAAQSKVSRDVLLPDLTKCVACHRTHPDAGQIASPCMSCHVNHPQGGMP